MKRILTDIDNSVFDFTHTFEAWAEEQGMQFKRGILGNTYEFEPMFDHEIDVPDMLGRFFDCERTMGSFRALDHAVEPVQRLRDQGYEFIAITACEDRPHMRQSRLDNLREVFGFEFDDLFVTGLNLPKSDILKRYGRSYWVEDNLEHAVDGAKIGHHTFLIDHPYNRGAVGPFTRVNDWREIEGAVCTVNSL